MSNTSTALKIRIKTTPQEKQIDGIQLEQFAPGTVRDVSPSLGTWLVAQGYAELEMRQSSGDGAESFHDHLADLYGVAKDRRKRGT